MTHRVGAIIVTILVSVLYLPPSSVVQCSVTTEEIQYVASKVECANPEEVASIIFREYNLGPEMKFERLDIGDGTPVYRFSPGGGSGSWAIRYNYLFELREQKLELLFDGQGREIHIASDGPKFNGRYRIGRGWRMEEDKSRFDGYAGETHFWDGSRYVLGKTSSSIYVTEEDARAGQSIDTVKFNPDALSFLKNARVSWRHVVQVGETLEGICAKYSTEVQEVIRQNALSDPNLLRAGQILTYDSARTRNGKHSNQAL